MKPKIHLSPLARLDIQEIGYYIALDNFLVGLGFIDRLFQTFELLAEQPKMGRARGEFPGLRSLALKPYIIFYRIREGGIEIIRVVHGSRDIAHLLEAEES
ncbi:MAG: type II toxin-antitoxin system RelE/ParE family toxin [Candidatus Sumerlaeota bacterium]|nr:type II toxin-antitoxin system RelE/ParE family toxin [Candidatus Sumerlaeota bacterium]